MAVVLSYSALENAKKPTGPGFLAGEVQKTHIFRH